MSILDKKEVTFWGSDTIHFTYQTSAQPFPVFLRIISVPTQAPRSLSFFCIISSKCTADRHYSFARNFFNYLYQQCR